MQQPFPDHFKDFADGIGIGLYQKLSLKEGSEVLQCSQNCLETRANAGDIESIQLPGSEIQFFGYQLVKYLIAFTTESRKTIAQSTPERIIRAPEVEKMTGLSRATIWRYQKSGTFPQRVHLSPSSVGWKLSEIQEWINSR